ncbi:MinD/ParA family ATP-binding protein [Pseudarthrobacter sp. J47]|uniref:MinD/ParA family ATP-binding protein n=1 Tax=Pseudarthrobacter sp. J47 TaxID=3116482 RepID=UPI002E808235|nr:hypothetical protein [Pseudarthrobacter sp. J47]MEE2524537.1 hypothetical protein [Pseudarthrobacter sp. J47]
MTPVVTAQLTEEGDVHLNVDGSTEKLQGRDAAEGRVHLIRAVSDLAEQHGEPIQVTVKDPGSGENQLIIDAQGNVERVIPPVVPAVDAAQPSEAAPAVNEAVEEPAEQEPVITQVPQEGTEAAQEPTLATRRSSRPTAADFAATRPTAAVGPALEGWQGVLNSLSGGALRISPGDKELQRRSWRASVQRGLAGHKTVVFINIKGGAGKTTKTYMVGATLGRVRGGNILAWDNNENKGTLGDRSMRANHDHTAIDLLTNVERFASPSNAHELVNYVHPQGENKFHVLASQNTAADKEVVDGAAFTQLHGALKQFYHLMVVDTGNASTAGTWQAAVEIADEIVIVAMNKEDSIKTLASTVDTLVQMGYENKLAKGVLLITESPVPQKNKAERSRKNQERLERTTEHFSHYVREIVVVPSDEALDDGEDIVYERLTDATREAFLHATAAIVDGL